MVRNLELLKEQEELLENGSAKRENT